MCATQDETHNELAIAPDYSATVLTTARVAISFSPVPCVSSQPSVRRTHNTGRKHRDEVRRYYEMWLEAQTGIKAMGECVCVCVHVCTYALCRLS